VKYFAETITEILLNDGTDSFKSEICIVFLIRLDLLVAEKLRFSVILRIIS